MANTEVGSAYVTIMPSMKGFQKGVENGVNSTFGKLRGVIAGAFSTAAVAAFGKAALDAYADYEQLAGGIETLFKDASGTVMKYADNAYKTSGLSANRYMEQVTSFSASLLQSLGGDTQKAAQYADRAVIDMSDNANKMGSSMQSIQDAYQGFAKQNYTMLDNLKLGYGGTKGEMERLIADANRVKQANGEMANLSIDSFADVTEAIHIIQTEMGITGTTAQEAEQTISGSVSAMKSAWENWVTGLGNENSNMKELTDQLVETVITAAGNVIPRMGEILGTLGQTLKEQAPVVVDKFLTAISEHLPPGMSQVFNDAVNGAKEAVSDIQGKIDPMLQTLKDLAPWVGAVAGGFIALKGALALSDLIGAVRLGLASMTGVTTLLSNAQMILNAVMNMNPFFAVATVIGVLVGAIATLYATNEDFRNFINGCWDAIKKKASDVWGKVVEFFTVTVPNGIKKMQEWFQNLPSNIANWLNSAKEYVGHFANTVKTDAINAGVNFLRGVSSGFNDAVEFVKSIPQRVLDALGNLGNLLVESGKSMLRGLGEGITKGFEDAKKAVSNGLQKIRDFFPFSPAKKGPFSGHGWVLYSGISIAEALGEGFHRAMPDALGEVEDGMSALRGPVLDFNARLGTEGYEPDGRGSVTQSFTFNQPIKSPDEVARSVRMAERYGFAADY